MKYLLILFAGIIIASCNTGFELDDNISVYKLKSDDYIELVSVELSKDKSRVIGFPDPGAIEDKVFPMSLSNDYYLNGAGIKSAYCSITLKEYSSLNRNIGPDSLYKLVIDDDPFLEYYLSDDGDGIWRTDNAYDEYRIDTAFINTLIMENRLEDYFRRLK